MGESYLFYTEAFVDNKWRCIDGYYPHKRNDGEYYLKLYTLYETYSTFFSETCDKIQSIGDYVKFSELSDEVQREHPGIKYKIGIWSHDVEREEEEYVVVPSDVFINNTPKTFRNHGIIHKNAISMYENNDIEEILEDDEINWSKIPDIEKQCYQYYEWDPLWSWNYYFKIIADRLGFTIQKYENNEVIDAYTKFRIVMITL